MCGVIYPIKKRPNLVFNEILVRIIAMSNVVVNPIQGSK